MDVTFRLVLQNCHSKSYMEQPVPVKVVKILETWDSSPPSSPSSRASLQQGFHYVRLDGTMNHDLRAEVRGHQGISKERERFSKCFSFKSKGNGLFSTDYFLLK